MVSILKIDTIIRYNYIAYFCVMSAESLIKTCKEAELKVEEIVPGQARVIYISKEPIIAINAKFLAETKDLNDINLSREEKLDELIKYKLLMDIVSGNYRDYKFDKKAVQLRMKYMKREYIMQLTTDFYKNRLNFNKEIWQVYYRMTDMDCIVKVWIFPRRRTYYKNGRVDRTEDNIYYGKIKSNKNMDLIKNSLHKINLKELKNYNLFEKDSEHDYIDLQFNYIEDKLFNVELFSEHCGKGKILAYSYL